MNAINLRKYEHTFLVLTSLLVTLLNNLPYYSMFFYSNTNYPKPERESIDIIFNVIWYTGQILFSTLIISYFNYFWIKYILPKKSSLIIRTPLIFVYNILISIILLKASIYLAGITIGYPFGEKAAFMYYMWKYIYLTPSAMLIAYILFIIVRKRIVELNNAKLIEENLSNQLKTLKDQIKPHFLFNTLNTLSAIIRNESREEGLKYVDDLAIVYRYILEKSNYDLVTFSSELEFAKSYVRLLKKRFNKKFEIKFLIPEKILLFQIPPLTLQLLIENAIKHNEFSKESPLNIKIFVDKDNLIIENNIQPKTSDLNSLGIGLQNLNKRYEILIEEKVLIIKNNGKFIVSLPLIKKQKF